MMQYHLRKNILSKSWGFSTFEDDDDEGEEDDEEGKEGEEEGIEDFLVGDLGDFSGLGIFRVGDFFWGEENFPSLLTRAET